MDLFENPLVLAKHVAEREVRSAFQKKYGTFWKCPSCGAYVAPKRILSEYAYHCLCGPAPAVRCGYTHPRLDPISAAALHIFGKAP